MSRDSSPFLVHLQDLKLWQGSYDGAFQSSKTSDRSPEIRRNVAEDWDKKAISPSKPFEQLLEEKLAEDRPVQVLDRPKRPFLRKGEGLARYRISSVPLKRRNAKKQAAPQHRAEFGGSALDPGGVRNVSTLNFYSDKAEAPVPPKKPDSPNIRRRGILKPEKPLKEDNFDRALVKNYEHSDVDLSPLSIPDFIKPRGTWHNVLEENKTEIVVEKPQTADQHEVTSLFQRGRHLTKFELPMSSSNDIPDSISKLVNLKVNDSERDLRIFETLEQRAESSSFCSTNSSILNILSSTPRKDRFQAPKGRVEGKLQEVTKQVSLLQNFLLNLRQMDKRRLSSDSDSSPRKSTSTASFSDEERWSTRSPSPVTECDSSSYMKKIDVAINTSFSSRNNDTIKENCTECEELRLRISQTKGEAVESQKERKKLKETVKELERSKETLNKDMQKMEKMYSEKIDCIKQELESEKRRFAKEKMVFETYVKQARNRPNKKERDEIAQLKQELADAKEMMKLKEAKNGATQARLRNQLKHMEKEVADLKSTLEKLRKENAKLTASQKYARRPSEVKMLHEINKNLSKLTEEALKKQLDGAGGDTTNRKQKDDADAEKEVGDETKKTLDENAMIEKQYESVFGQFSSPRANVSGLEKTESTLEDGTIEIRYGNGNVKTISPDGNLVTVRYFNGDLKETNIKERIIRYHYALNDSWHIQYGDGTEVIEYANGQKSKKYTDGKVEITYPDTSFRVINPDGTEEESFPDGSKTIKNNIGEQIILLSNGQKEIHTKEYKRREYPDGTTRTLYQDGTVETVYANGRVRIKNPKGDLIMDTQPVT